MPSVDDLNIDKSVFWAAHSPGQYVLPALLSNTGLPLGLSLKVIQTTCLLMGVVGYYILFSFFRFPKSICLASCLITVTNRYILFNAYVYTGGPLFLFAFYPWVVLGFVRILLAGGPSLLWLPILIVVSAFLKLSFMLIALSIYLGIAFFHLRRSVPHSRSPVLKVVSSTLSTMLGLVIVHISYTSRGWTAADVSQSYGLENVGVHFLYSLGAILSSVFPIFWVSLHLGFPLQISSNLPAELTRLGFGILVCMGLTVIVIFSFVLQRVKVALYRELLLSGAAVHVMLLSLFFTRGGLATEDRHFWPVGILLLPGLLCLVTQVRKRIVCLPFLVVVLLFSAYGLASFGINLNRLALGGRSTSLGVSFPGYKQEVIDLMEAVDRELLVGRNVFFVLEPALALLVRQNAVFVPANTASAFNRSYYGKVDRLIVLLKDDLVETVGLKRILDCFPDVRQWHVGRVSECVVLYAGVDVPFSLKGLTSEWREREL